MQPAGDEVFGTVPLRADKGLYHFLLRQLGQLLNARSGQAIYFDSASRPHYLSFFRTPKEVRSLYKSHYYKICPMREYWSACRERNIVDLNHVKCNIKYDRRYFVEFYRKSGHKDEIAFFLPVGQTSFIGIFLESPELYSHSKFDNFKTVSPFVFEMHQREIDHLTEAVDNVDPGTRSNDYVIFDRMGEPVVWSDGLFPTKLSTFMGMDLLRNTMSASPWSGEIGDAGYCEVTQLPETFSVAPGGYICRRIDNWSAGSANPLEEVIACLVRVHGLTLKECRIIELLLLGDGNEQIAQKLSLSNNTIKTHKKNIYRKLDITSERELLAYVFRYLSAFGRRRTNSAHT